MSHGKRDVLNGQPLSLDFLELVLSVALTDRNKAGFHRGEVVSEQHILLCF